MRPLYDDGASEAKAATRDYVFELDTPGGAPLLSIYGGKITTYRRLAEEALERLAPYLRSAKAQAKAGPARRRCPAATWMSRRSPALTAELMRELSVPQPGACQPARACLWHACQQIARQCEISGRSRPILRRHLDGKRSQVPDGERMGLHRRGHRVATVQARLAAVGRRDRCARRMDQGPPRLRRTSLARSGRADMSVTLEHVTRTVDGIPTIRDVSLTLERGTLSVLLGPTLSGKTSIMRLLAGLDKPTTGRVLVDGKDVTGVDVRQRSVAMVYQQFINYPSLTVYENIASPLRVQGRPREEIDRRVQEAARLLRLEPYLKRTPLQLVRRPAAAHRDRARAGQGRRSGAARRAARQSRLQAARGTAHRTAAHLRGVRRDLRLRHHRALRGAAARRQHRLHVGRRGAAGRRHARRSIASPTRCGWRRCSPIRRSTSSASRRRTALCNMPAASRRRPPASTRRSPTAPIASASAPISSKSPTASPAATPSTPP